MTKGLSRRSVLQATGALALASFGPRGASARGTMKEPRGEGPVYGQGLLVELRVKDLERSIRFYTQVLGFRVAERRDDLQFVHVDCGVDRLQLGLSAGSPELPSAGSVILNFDVAGDVDVVRASLERKGVRFEGPTQVIAGKVRLAAFLDPDGYRLRLAGQDARAS